MYTLPCIILSLFCTRKKFGFLCILLWRSRRFGKIIWKLYISGFIYIIVYCIKQFILSHYLSQIPIGGRLYISPILKCLPWPLPELDVSNLSAETSHKESHHCLYFGNHSNIYSWQIWSIQSFKTTFPLPFYVRIVFKMKALDTFMLRSGTRPR